MLDLDKYMNNSIEIRLFNEKVDVLEPTVKMFMEVDSIEQDLTEENFREKRVEIAHLFLNHNKQKITYKKEAILDLPFEAINTLVETVCKMKYKADVDPN